MSAENTNLTTPVGRLVMGSLYKPNTTDAEGRPLLVKNGPNAGQPRSEYYFALAIPKGAEQAWSHTEWGAVIYNTGVRAFPQGQYQKPDFAWKIEDGDSTIPNQKGRKNVDREGHKGHWILKFSSGNAPKTFNADGTQAITEQGAVKTGYYVQVNCTVAGNESTQRPGLYLNHNMVALAGYGPEIVVGPDPTAVGFGSAPLPAGASAVPVGAFAPAAPAAPAAPMAQAAPPAPMAPPAPAAPPAAVAAVAVPPSPAFLAPPPPPAAPARVMLPAANGASYEQLLTAGWTDAQMVQHGMMAA